MAISGYMMFVMELLIAITPLLFGSTWWSGLGSGYRQHLYTYFRSNTTVAYHCIPVIPFRHFLWTCSEQNPLSRIIHLPMSCGNHFTSFHHRDHRFFGAFYPNDHSIAASTWRPREFSSPRSSRLLCLRPSLLALLRLSPSITWPVLLMLALVMLCFSTGELGTLGLANGSISVTRR